MAFHPLWRSGAVVRYTLIILKLGVFCAACRMLRETEKYPLNLIRLTPA
jgi:hypothetical protein